MDFNLRTFTKLLRSLKENGYCFQTFQEFIENPEKRCIILRHDIDRYPENALKVALIENGMSIKATFYFQIFPHVYNIDIIKRISEQGHEIGYHYKDIENVVLSKSLNFDNSTNFDLIVDQGYESFLKNLAKMRQTVMVKTICMHGSPRFKLDNRLIWKKYNYKDLDLIGEPYYDIDWDNVAYLTDSGRSWNGKKFIVRDIVDSRFKFNFKSTYDIINNINNLPDRVMITIHPQRWTDNIL